MLTYKENDMDLSGENYVPSAIMDKLINQGQIAEGVIEKYMATIDWCKFINSLAYGETEAARDFIDMILHSDGENPENIRDLYLDYCHFHKHLPDAKCFEIDKDVFYFAVENFDRNVPMEPETPVPVDYRPCSDVMYISVEGIEGLNQSWLVVRNKQDENLIHFGVCPSKYRQAHEEGIMFPAVSTGSWNLATNKITKSRYVQSDNFDNVIEAVFGIIQIINNPRFLIDKPAGTRQQRKQMHRGMGKAVDVWHKITWNIGDPTVAKKPYDETFHKMPLHYTRGHWRRAKETDPKSVQRSKAINPEHRKMWWTWIEGFWSGHPAFGIKKSYHAPKIKVQ